MSRPPANIESSRQWLAGLVVMIVTIVCLFSFARISITAVIIASGVTLLSTLILSWFLGRRLRARGRR